MQNGKEQGEGKEYLDVSSPSSISSTQGEGGSERAEDETENQVRRPASEPIGEFGEWNNDTWFQARKRRWQKIEREGHRQLISDIGEGHILSRRFGVTMDTPFIKAAGRAYPFTAPGRDKPQCGAWGFEAAGEEKETLVFMYFCVEGCGRCEKLFLLANGDIEERLRIGSHLDQEGRTREKSRQIFWPPRQAEGGIVEPDQRGG